MYSLGRCLAPVTKVVSAGRDSWNSRNPPKGSLPDGIAGSAGDTVHAAIKICPEAPSLPPLIEPLQAAHQA